MPEKDNLYQKTKKKYCHSQYDIILETADSFLVLLHANSLVLNIEFVIIGETHKI